MKDLSQRQRQVLRLLARGEAPKQIARELGVSVATVRAHLQRSRDRCNAPTAVLIAQIAVDDARSRQD